MTNSLLSRRRDLFYFVHFLFALPLMFLIDFQAIYDPSLVPAFMKKAKGFYVERYKDRFFIDPPPFFKLFVWSEVFVQAPVMLWSLGGLYRTNNGKDSPNLPFIILPFALLVFITTLTCMFLSHRNLGTNIKIAALMGIDMFFRLKNMTETKVQQKKRV
ncbi:hypothetical protein GcM1_196039 [Golovinomyces cichoracearum]|uniref:EXPERA domain-containing protein n=1 Tax=Golovinomyces cichoracearum TaxID=62708 RepID=A0A420J027_9PEZI|nr:hypothetical protein GcM1_196039 [Golovinomyces cichoracearum]